MTDKKKPSVKEPVKPNRAQRRRAKKTDQTVNVGSAESKAKAISIPLHPTTGMAKLSDVAISRRAALVDLTVTKNATEKLLQAVTGLTANAEVRYWDCIAQQLKYDSLQAVKDAGMELFVDDGTLEAKIITKAEGEKIQQAIQQAEAKAQGKTAQGEPAKSTNPSDKD